MADAGVLTVVSNVTLDGVMQAPARPDEDTRDDFAHGGWAIPYQDAAMAGALAEGMTGEGALLLGRRTYEDFYAVWPSRAGNPYTDVLNNTQKYVASSTLAEPLPWVNSTLLAGDTIGRVRELKAAGTNLTVLGSGLLVRSLMLSNVVDQYLLLIYPLVLGQGRRLFASDVAATLELTQSTSTPTGVTVARYRHASSEDS